MDPAKIYNGLREALERKDMRAFSKCVYHCFSDIIRNNHPAANAAVLFQHPENTAPLPISKEEVSKIVIDVITILEVESPSKDKEIAGILDELVNKQKILDLTLCKEFLNPKLMHTAKLIRETTKFHERNIYAKSRLHYTLDKYNLFREESEGYSKLIYELMANHSNDETLIKNIISLIGYFDLDPNRVVDVILDALELTPKFSLDTASKVLGMFNRQSIPHILGFKFQNNANLKNKDVEKLCLVTAQLIKRKFLTVQEIYAHLSPSDEIMAKSVSEYIRQKTVEAKKFDRVSTEESLENELIALLDETPSFFVDNQKLQMLRGLLNADAVEEALLLLNKLSPYSPTLSIPVCEALCGCIGRAMDPVYSKISPSYIFSETPKENIPITAQDVALLNSTVFPLLTFLGANISRDIILFTKLCRVMRDLFEKKMIVPRDYSLMIEILLDGLHFVSNTALSYEIWNMLQVLPYELRFEVFGSTHRNINKDYKFTAQIGRTSAETRKILKRLAKENTKNKGRVLAKYAHMSPYVVCERILQTAELYDNQIPYLIEALKYVSSIVHDAMAAQLLHRLLAPGTDINPERARLKEDGSIAQWLQNLSTFCGMYYKKYNMTELEPLVKFVINRIKQGGWPELIIVRDLIKYMSGIEIVEDINPQQLEAHAGGDLLRSQAGGFSAATLSKQTKKTSTRLHSVLIQHGNARDLLLLMGRLRAAAVHAFEEGELDSSYLKQVMECHDRCHDTLLALLRFLQEACTVFIVNGESENPNVLNLPSFDVFAKLKIEPEITCAILRPAIKFRQMLDLEAPVFDNIKQLLPGEPKLSKRLYTLFWMLDLYDIYIPTGAYKDEIQKLERQRAQPETNSKKRQQLEGIVRSLAREQSQQTETNEKIVKYIKSVKGSLVDQANSQAVMEEFMQYCILPRCVVSSTDALYCIRFIELMHNLEVPFFSSLRIFGWTLMNQAIMRGLTENEAQRYAKYLLTSLTVQARYAKKEIYQQECANNICFLENYKTGTEAMPYQKWFDIYVASLRILVGRFKVLLEDRQNIIQIRNALVMLNGIINVFPVYKDHKAQLEKQLVVLKEHDLEAVSTLAQRYHTQLESASSRITEDAPLSQQKLAGLAKQKAISTSSKQSKSVREPKEIRDSREQREKREDRENREAREPREPKEAREPRENKEQREREPRESREPREPRESKSSKLNDRSLPSPMTMQPPPLLEKPPSQPSTPVSQPPGILPDPFPAEIIGRGGRREDRRGAREEGKKARNERGEAREQREQRDQQREQRNSPERRNEKKNEERKSRGDRKGRQSPRRSPGRRGGSPRRGPSQERKNDERGTKRDRNDREAPRERDSKRRRDESSRASSSTENKQERERKKEEKQKEEKQKEEKQKEEKQKEQKEDKPADNRVSRAPEQTKEEEKKETKVVEQPASFSKQENSPKQDKESKAEVAEQLKPAENKEAKQEDRREPKRKKLDRGALLQM